MSSNAPEPKRLLVLTSATGAGHDTHAHAAAAWCSRLYGANAEVTVVHALEDSHAFYRHGVDFYNFIQRRMPWFHHIYYNVVELMEALNPGTVSFGRDYYISLLEKTRPDAILSVMDCLNRGYFELAKEVLGSRVKCATYCTEFTGGYGFSRNWVNPRGDYFLGRTAEAAREGVRRGMRAERSLIAGHWAPPAFYDPPLRAEEKAAYLRDNLGLDPERFTLLLSTGGAGAQNHAAILRALFPLGDRLQVIALCGRDPAAKSGLEAWAKKEAPFPVRALGFTDEMPKLLQACSAVVARAGATTAGEALLCGCPIIFNVLGGIMPQEMPTWRYFRARKIGFIAQRPAGIRSVVEWWTERPESYLEVREGMRAARDATTPEQALGKLIS
jgi:processive 1,2-diacylglycerol beta-glucosyltransferase